MTTEIALIGEVVDPRDLRIVTLEREVQGLRRAVADAEIAARRAREDSDRALAALRRQLSPLYQALQAVFGELDAAGVAATPMPGTPDAAAPPTMNPRVRAVWEDWKRKLPPICGKIIDALLEHGELSQVQLKVAARLGSTSVSNAVSKLNTTGLITKNGGRVSLKAL